MNGEFRERNFGTIGGLHDHIKTLKEMIIYPLLYRDLFDTYGIQAPRGVLFYGPPGTGKTLMAGAVAAECGRSTNRKVAFYLRKGGDCLNKYVGESEKQLQTLFSQAHATRPSIIFFDEIDGLVPTRSELQEQVHASVVSTLLALMDGLDTKSEVFIIGATNRIDMIDPALRRPGRFDRELYFPLPPLESRYEIIKIHTSNWKQKPSEEFMLKLAAKCSGYCGADIQSLCSQAVMQSFNRSFPQVLDTTQRQPVRSEDFWEAMDKIVPASQRVYNLPSRPLSSELEPLLKRSLDECVVQINKLCPFCFLHRNSQELSKNRSLSCPRFLLMGKGGQAHISHLAPAVLHFFDHLPVVVMDLTTINEDARNSDSSSLVHKIDEARQSMPSIIYLRNVTAWWTLIDETARQVLVSSLESLDTSSNSKIFIFGTASANSYDSLPAEIKQIFVRKKCYEVSEPTLEERKKFFRQVLVEKNLLPPKTVERVEIMPPEVREVPGFVGDEPMNSSRKRKFGAKVDVVSKLKLEPFGNVNTSPAGRLRNGKTFRPASNNTEFRPAKRLKFEMVPPCCSTDEVDSKKTEDAVVIIDAKKLEKLVESAVKVTGKARVTALVRLYEELEIVSLRYGSKLDRTSLPDELEREISLFHPT